MTTVEERLRAKLEVTPEVGVAVARFVADARAEIDVAYCEFSSPIGTLLLASTDRGLVRIGFETDVDLQDLATRVSPRILEAPARLTEVSRQLTEYFEGRRRSFGLPLDRCLIGGFRSAVLAATSQIPYGEVRTYGQIAARAGSPKGARATGSALGGNPIPLVIPCHRVVPAGGGVGGYAGGSERKTALLDLERRVLGSRLRLP